MIARLVIALAVAGLLVACAGSASVSGSPAVQERRILVMVADPDIGRLDLRGSRSGVYRQSRTYAGTPARVAQALKAIADDHRLTSVEGWPMRSLGVHCAVFEVEAGASVDDVIASLEADARVESVQRMQAFELQASSGHGAWDDPYLSLQSSLADSGITRAHLWATGKGVRIAIVDTGIDIHHPDLRGQAVETRNFMQGGAGGADRHGTAVAGVIASIAGNRRGIVGVAPAARILALQACTQRDADGRGDCTSFSLARAIDHAITAGSDVLNLSLGGPSDVLLERLLSAALARDIVVVAAQGDGQRASAFPAGVRGVIAVGSASSPADATRLAAPGRDVLTLVPPDGYDYLSGSSMAAAHVSGIVALLLERAPALHAAEVESLLLRTARPAGRAGAGSVPAVSACDALAALSATVRCDAVEPPGRAAHAAAAIEALEPD
ncbi:MAG TPA: S8 family serine peptidase [Steroidobacteraceae bacterium]|nr:S8 family serine peptidase [Steroidobacteraceae bacterium]